MKQKLFLEEAVLDDLAKDFDLLELPLSERVFKLAGLSIVIVIVIVVSRLFFLGVFKGDFYSERSLTNSNQSIPIASQRGIISDRFNKPLVKNSEIYHLSLRLPELFKKNELEKIFPILKETLNFSRQELEDLIKSANLEKQDLITLAVKLNEEQIEKLKNFDSKALLIKKDFNREYFNAGIFSHLLGYVGATDDDFKNFKVGKSGLERYYDEELAGQEGKIVYYRNAKGEAIDIKFLSEARKGHGIQTTIDSEFQNFFYQTLKDRLDQLDVKSGAGIAINPSNGEVLSLVSLPSFDANEITEKDLSNSHKPLFNRAISGLYAPGSTIKPLVALAALNENIIKPTDKIFSRGYIEIPNPYYPDKPSRYLDWQAHGWVDLYSGLARSSNVYFYSIGGGLPYSEIGIVKGLPRSDAEHLLRGLGIEKLKEYWQKFGLGEKTGIDLSAERSGYLPDSDSSNKENRQRSIWRLGDTYNVSIGQGDLLLTPIEIINYIAAIANSGKIYRPFVVKKIIDEKGGIVSETEPQILKDHSGDILYFKEVQKGMIDVVSRPYGTANLLSDLPFKVAAKTGTAQINNNTRINAFFVGYAPVDEPQIAILVLIENAQEGSLNALPVAKDVLNWYYENRIKQ